jgi:predicted amidohydrolase YtcJ
VDTHIHIEWTSAARHLDLNIHTQWPRTMAELLARIRAHADRTPAGRWIVVDGPFVSGGRGPSASPPLQERRLPTVQELDSVSERHPIALFDGVHTNVANSLGAKMMGYLTYEDEAQARWWSHGQPYTGGTVERDEDGHAGPAHDFVMRLPRDIWSVQDLKSAIEKTVVPTWVAGGVTSASPVCLVSSNEYAADQQLQAEGKLPMRLRAYYMAPFSVGVDQVLDTGVTRGFGNDMFRTGGFKLIMDGGRTRDGRRALHYTQDELADVITKIQARGLQAIVHSGGPGMEITTGAVEEVRRRFPKGERIAHRLEHSTPPMELARRVRDAGMYFTIIAAQDPPSAPAAGARPRSRTPFRSFLAEGIRPILISDKCSGSPPNPRPMVSIADACNPGWNGEAADQAVTFDEALSMWTLWAAQSTHQDHDRGSIAVGKLGDFAVLSGDPRRMEPAQYFDLKVDATILGGQVVYGS